MVSLWRKGENQGISFTDQEREPPFPGIIWAMSQKFSLLENLENILPLAFAEDTPDITSQALADLHENLKARIVAKAYPWRERK